MNAPRRWLDPDSDAPDGARELLAHARRTAAADKAALAVSAAALAKLSTAPAGVAALALGVGGKLMAAASIVALAGAVAVQIAQPPARVAAPAQRAIDGRTRPAPRQAQEQPRAASTTVAPLEPPPPSQRDVDRRHDALPPASTRRDASAARPGHVRVPAWRPARSIGGAAPALRGGASGGVAPALRRGASSSASPAAPAQALGAHDRLALEVRALDRARATLVRDPAAALRELDQHAAHFPDAALSAERELIAVDALQRLGRHDDARARADALLLRHPSSLYRSRLRSLLERAP
jgi:hypothetical protein